MLECALTCVLLSPFLELSIAVCVLMDLYGAASIVLASIPYFGCVAIEFLPVGSIQ
jgi:hypothetical protein